MNPKVRPPLPLVCALLCLAALALALHADPALAQGARHPFAVGANEGTIGRQGGLGAWLLAQESRFYLGLTQAVRDAATSTGALLALMGLSFAYGVFHAAGPGHGKAVIASYMVSNEVALRRGLMLALLAALLQAVVATAIVGIAAFAFNATAPRMTEAAQAIELTSYLGIVAMGLVLVWRKGGSLAAVLRPARRSEPPALAAASAGTTGEAPYAAARPASGRFVADDGTAHVHGQDCGCGHAHIPAAALLQRARLDWRTAGLAVLTAGARPCSGAILVLVFALSQGVFLAGVGATFAMAIGTAITTGALATMAVFAKDLAVWLLGTGSARAASLVRLVEFAAALGILVLGLVLLSAALTGVHAAG